MKKDILVSDPYGNIKPRLEKRLNNNFNYIVTKGKYHIVDLVIEQVRKGNKLIAFAGGDTTVDHVMNIPFIRPEAQIDLQKLIFLITYQGTAGNGEGNNRIGKKHPESYSFIDNILLGNLNPENYTIPTDLLRITYDSGKQLNAMSSISLGFTALICNQAEKTAYESWFRYILSKKVNYALATLKTMPKITNHPFIKAHITYHLADGTTKECELDNILAFTQTLETYFAGMRGWSNGCSYDGKMETVIFRKMNFFKILELAMTMNFSKSHNHLSKALEKDGFNPYGVHYQDEITSLEMRIQGKSPDVCHILEAGGTTHYIEKPDAPIKIEVMPAATNLIYMPREVKQPEGFAILH